MKAVNHDVHLPIVVTFMAFTMAAQIATGIRGIVPGIANGCVGAAEGIPWRKFERRGCQIAEMSVRQFCDAVAYRAGETLFLNMLLMLTRVVAIVLRCPCSMTGGTLRVDIDRASQPVGCGLPAVTPGAGASAAVAAGRATLGIKSWQDVDIGRAVIMGGTIMAGPTGWSCRTKTECGVIGMGPFSVRSGSS